MRKNCKNCGQPFKAEYEDEDFCCEWCMAEALPPFEEDVDDYIPPDFIEAF